LIDSIGESTTQSTTGHEQIKYPDATSVYNPIIGKANFELIKLHDYAEKILFYVVYGGYSGRMLSRRKIEIDLAG
jgi:hypothetical protein